MLSEAGRENRCKHDEFINFMVSMTSGEQTPGRGRPLHRMRDQSFPHTETTLYYLTLGISQSL